MKRYWTIPVTIIAGLLVAFVVARDLALLVTDEKQKAAVAHLNARLEKTPSLAEKVASAGPPQPAVAEAQPADTVAKGLRTQWETVLKQADQKRRDCYVKNESIVEKLWRYQPSPDSDFAAPPEEVASLDAYFAENEDYFRQALELLDSEPIPLDAQNALSWDAQSLLTLISLEAVSLALDKEDENAAKVILIVEKQIEPLHFQFSAQFLDLASIETIRRLVTTPSGLDLADKVAGVFRKIHAHENFAQTFAEGAQLWLKRFSQDYKKLSPLENPQMWAYATVFEPLYDHDLQQFCAVTEKMLDLADQPFYEVKPALLDIQETYHERSQFRPMGAAGWAYSFARQARDETIADLMSIAVAAHQYQRLHGAFPDNLSETADLLGATLPVEPFSGKPYAYKKTDDTFELEATVPEWLGKRVTDGTTMKWRDG